MKEAYYFSHDANARHDYKILELRAAFGWEGYGLFWALIETLRDCSDYSFPSNAKAALALSLNIDKAKLEQLILKCLELGLFVEENGFFFSESLMRRMEQIDQKRRKRAEAGRLGGKAKAMSKQSHSNAKAKASKESKVKESKTEDNNINGTAVPVNSISEMFEACRKIYPGTKRGLETELSDLAKKYKSEFSTEFFRAIYKGISLKIKTNKELERAGQFVPEWPHFKTYLFQRRWEEETKIQPKATTEIKPYSPRTQEEQDELFGGISEWGKRQRELQKNQIIKAA